MSEDLRAQLEKTLQAAKVAIEEEKVANYENLDRQIRLTDDLARETFQGLLSDKYQPLLNKLQRGEQLTKEEHKELELLIVGGAAYYLIEEADFESWIIEISRITEEMKKSSEAGLDTVDELMDLRALCLDAEGLLHEIVFYLNEKERVERFRENTREITPETGRILAGMIQEMMTSDEM
ncbi:MAG: hypothetical protein GTO18_12925 [Anaerolineales bacterium]|nr:hypothetical protein [Anaerolineales bacterium]